jgi:hypothetical protein
MQVMFLMVGLFDCWVHGIFFLYSQSKFLKFHFVLYFWMIFTEKTEGLQRFSPFIMLGPLAALTHNYTLSGGVGEIVSAPSKLESSSLVLSFGGGAVDLHLNRVMPSMDFDLLSSDFNHMLLVAILLALATAVLMLRSAARRKHLGTIWA